MKPHQAAAKLALATRLGTLLPCLIMALPCAAQANETSPADSRLRDVVYSPNAVVTVYVKRGVVTLVALDGEEAIAELAAGLGGDCAKADSAWCISAQPAGRHFFIKPKGLASGANNVLVVTDRRHHSFRFVVLDDKDPRQATYKLVVKPAAAAAAATNNAAQLTKASSSAATARRDGVEAENSNASPAPFALLPLLADWSAALLPPAAPTAPTPQRLVADRLQQKPQVLNTRYALAEGVNAQDIVPSLVFDDGRFTYFRFPGHRDVPAVFQVLADGTEALVNTRMEEDLLVVDRVCRRLMLRAGSAAVGIWNEAFELDGVASPTEPGNGTTVPGVERVLKAPVANRHEAAAAVPPQQPIPAPPTAKGNP